MWELEFIPNPYNNDIGDNGSGQRNQQKQQLVKAKASVESILAATIPIPIPSTATASPGGSLTFSKVKDAFHDVNGGLARATLAHLYSHALADATPFFSTTSPSNDSTPLKSNSKEEEEEFVHTIMALNYLQPLDSLQSHQNNNNNSANRRKRKKTNKKKPSSTFPPYIFQRTDVWCDIHDLNVNLIVVSEQIMTRDTSSSSSPSPMNQSNDVANNNSNKDHLSTFIKDFLDKITQKITTPTHDEEDDTINTNNTTTNQSTHPILSHVANTVLQHELRSQLSSLGAVAFIANGSILPRKSGASFAPMTSPPAIPFIAPEDSSMTQTITIMMRQLYPFINLNHPAFLTDKKYNMNGSMVTLKGMFIPRGITLIVGGGYHGKSTMLRTIACGVYNKVMNDGREFCVTVDNAVTTRAEDGRYVHNTNVSAFISNLPIIGKDTTTFSTREASGSTSQATNVAEAIEMKASVMLVDEDVSAANFMSRDGRMRALVMDESITPLLYRVNGLFDTHGISSVVVVGGVGDWLDVPHNVIRLDKYVASDALKKARSISAQFSYGHVQYAGRGVVHRLQWKDPDPDEDTKNNNDDDDGRRKKKLSITPRPRRVVNAESLLSTYNCCISLLDGGGRLSLFDGYCMNDENDNNEDSVTMDESEEEEDDDDDDEDIGMIDMTRCEQLLGGNPQLFGCGICALWILKRYSRRSSWKYSPKFQSINDLFVEMEDIMNTGAGVHGILVDLIQTDGYDDGLRRENHKLHSLLLESLLKSTGYAIRPRRYEVLMTLTRMRGLLFEEVPMKDDEHNVMSAAEREAAERKKALAELWANRRGNKNK